MNKRAGLKVVGALVGLVALCAACEPGWTNPVLGTGDGSGTTPGSVSVAADQVALGYPLAMVDLGARGFLAYDAANCTIMLVAHGQATRFAGNGICGDTGDGGPATAAEISPDPMPIGGGISADPSGNVYFTTTLSSKSGIRRIDATTGDITTVSGTADERIFGLSAEANGQLTYLTDTEVNSGLTDRWTLRRNDSKGNDSVLASYQSDTIGRTRRIRATRRRRLCSDGRLDT